MSHKFSLTKLTGKVTKGGGLVAAVAGAAIVGGASTALVMAAIPSSDGTINGCYNKNTGALKVIDAEAGKTCTSKQTALNWNTGNGIQYAYIQQDKSTGALTIDASHSKGATGITAVPEGGEGSPEIGCITFATDPSTYTVITPGSSTGGGGFGADVKTRSGWLNPGDNGSYCDQSVPGANAYIAFGESGYGSGTNTVELIAFP